MQLTPWKPSKSGGYYRKTISTSKYGVGVFRTVIPDAPDRYEYKSYEEYCKAYEDWENKIENKPFGFVISITTADHLRIPEEERIGFANSCDEAQHMVDTKLKNYGAILCA